ncbi:tetratricopeptide repeat protein [Noviherbaspirillum pedocola]|uniref:Tetratricopeptide repeat protein n=1 Tax=Noviherbaspirillum pedocola TaxID=2801341 RepID=A0A934SUH2_9BURK|nr:tetratricopeptide repeat protein [Noviherbaspirillum pedocola]MBK4735680.1 tetratricopeptide repeat protein [Noviherbaspirillum pedocola]
MSTDLDAEELKFLAMGASRANSPEQALVYLKHALQAAPEDGELLYLLAAEHAQLGMYDRAAEEMTRALALRPDMYTARLQLGLLHLGAARVDAATDTLRPLTNLDANNCFHHFALGLEHLMRDRFSACRSALEQGIALNNVNAPLNGDMRKIIDALPDDSVAENEGNVWLSAYRQDDASH